MIILSSINTGFVWQISYMTKKCFYSYDHEILQIMINVSLTAVTKHMYASCIHCIYCSNECLAPNIA